MPLHATLASDGAQENTVSSQEGQNGQGGPEINQTAAVALPGKRNARLRRWNILIYVYL